MNRADLQSLRNMIDEAKTILATTKLPEGRAERAYELLDASVAIADSLLESRLSMAASLGAKGGAKTAEKGPDHFKKMAAARKTFGGGRPRKIPLDK